VIDGGGSALKWLFGVTTQADLAGLNKKISGLTGRENEIVHLMDHQATVVNESFWEIRTNTKLIQELEGQTAELTKNNNNLLGRMAERQA
jgi:leucyl aminopeptidase